MYCQHCGEQISELAEICPKCGVRVKEKVVNNNSDFFGSCLSFSSSCCIPLFGLIVGVIMYYSWKDDKPKAAKSALFWGILAFIFWLIVLGIFIGFVEAMAEL